MRDRLLITLLILVFVLPAAVPCQLQGEGISGKLYPGAAQARLRRTAKDVRVYDCLKVTLEIERESYCSGESVPMTLALKNIGDEPLTLRFSSGQQYDFIVARSGKEVWRWSADKVFIQVLGSLTLAPGETREFKQTWQQKDNEGQQVPAGEYEITGLVTTMGTPRPKAGPVPVKIVPKQ